MKTLCITSTAHPALQAVTKQLLDSGMAAAHPGQRSEALDISAWHQRVLAKHSGGVNGLPLGRLWEQLATDIFMANIDSPVWGWSDPHSIELLDFWYPFDPHLYFVLVCISPLQAMAHAIASPTEGASANDVLRQWQTSHQAMLRFHLRHPERSVLVCAEAALAQGSQLVETLAARWDLPLQATGAYDALAHGLYLDPVAGFLAQQLLENCSAEHALHQEILAGLTPLGQHATPAAQPFTTERAVAAYRQLRERSEQAALLEQQQAALQASHNDLSQQIQSLKGARDEQSRLAGERLQQIDALNQEKTALTAELSTVKEESELLLLQLHQVQEELESLFLKEQQGAQQLNALKAELASLTAASEALKKQSAELAKERDKQTQLASQRQSQIDTLSREKTSLASERDTLTRNNAELTKARDQQTREAKECREKIDALNQEKTALAADLNNAQEDSELLLLQLHQVQEELEHYFLEFQKVQQNLQAQETRWQRMLQRNPGYCDYTQLSAASTAEPTTLDWTLDGLETAGRHISQLECQTRIVDGHVAICIKHTPDNPQLLRWPAHAPDNEILLTAGSETTRKTLAQLATSDFILVDNLARVFEKALSKPAELQLTPAVPAAALQVAFGQFVQQLGALPPTLRYDRVRLKNNQLNPDYEHLWLVVDNLSLGAHRWPQFEFRLACANVGPQRFGTHPKLEFPRDTGQAPLPGWFEESYDDNGAKLEIRFALPDAMDMQTWGQLGDVDHHFLRALCALLPDLLNDLQATGTRINRAWQDWHDLTGNVQRILALYVPEARQLQVVA
jgi:uncharacterized coiled-coil DUF342 family protein